MAARTALVANAPLRAAAGCALIGLAVGALRAEWATLPRALERRGLAVEPGARSVLWVDPPRLGARRALVLAREARGGLPDVYAVTARTAPDGRLVTLSDVSNLTRSREASEEALAADGRYAAFASRVEGRVTAFSVVDVRGEPRGLATLGVRFRAAVTRWQRTGSVGGYASQWYALRAPAPSIELAVRGAEVTARVPAGEVRVDAARGAVVEGERLARARPRVEPVNEDWVTWTVNTVRSVSWIGPAPISWLESWAFRAQHAVAVARVATGQTAQPAQLAEELTDVLAGAPSADALEGVVEAWPPPPITPRLAGRASREGEWLPVSRGDDPVVRTNPGAPPAMYATFVRVDAERPDAPVYIAVWDPRQVEIHVAPGAEEPMGATGELGTGAIPRDERTMNRLVGAFNGGFQALHGEFGIYGEGMLLLPPKPYAATVALMADGSTAFGSWPNGLAQVPDDVVEFRQNLTALVDDGAFNPWGRWSWGLIFRGTGNADPTHTARSGLCMTREGHVAYLWGAALSPRSLADGMIAARCRYGIHLDMNGSNLGFELYRAGRAGALPALPRGVARNEYEGNVTDMPGVRFRARRLVRGMAGPFPRYIRREGRDFFYLLLRAVLPGAPIAPVVSPALPGEGQWRVAGLGDTPFPWPMARTRLRPDRANPERWVNLVRVDARRVALAPPEASERVVARFANATLARGGGGLRIGMTEGAAGPRWTIGAEGDGIAGEALAPGASPLRGAGIDADGFLVLAVADRAVPDLVARALDAAGCGPARVALTGAVLALPRGGSAGGDPVPAGALTALALVERPFGGARRIFPEVTPVPPSVWEPIQRRQVRYHSNGDGTMTVRLSGQAPVVLPLRGVPRPAAPARDAGP